MNKQLTIGNVPYTPEEAGYESLYIERLNDFIMRMIDDKIIMCGSYHLMRHGKLFAHNAIGSLDYRNLESRFLPDSIRNIASITKDFTAVAIFQLAEKGYININDPAAMHLKEFDTALHRKITVYNLLTHTSGLLPDGGAFEAPYPNEWVNHLERFEGNWIKAMLTQPPHCPVNTQWAYSSFGFCFLGEIIKRITGSSAENFILENITMPLGMNDTHYDLPKEKLERYCVCCEWEIPDNDNNDENKNDPWFLLPGTGWGLKSTLGDLNIFNQMMHNGGKHNGVRIIGRKSVENIVLPHLNGQNMRNYCWGADELHDCGLGFEVMNNKPFNQMTVGTYGHEGSGVCWSYVDPKEDFIASMFLPYYNGEFNIIPIHRTKYIVWGGLI